MIKLFDTFKVTGHGVGVKGDGGEGMTGWNCARHTQHTRMGGTLLTHTEIAKAGKAGDFVETVLHGVKTPQLRHVAEAFQRRQGVGFQPQRAHA